MLWRKFASFGTVETAQNEWSMLGKFTLFNPFLDGQYLTRVLAKTNFLIRVEYWRITPWQSTVHLRLTGDLTFLFGGGLPIHFCQEIDL